MNANLQRYFLSILAKKDYSIGELLFKGLNKDYSNTEVQEVISWLLDRKFVSDLRLAENLIQSYKSKKGKIWIVQKLRARKIDNEIIQKALSENLSDDIQPSNTVKEKLERKYKIVSWDQIDQNTKQKVVGFLNRQGFTNSWQIIQSWSLN
jgi:regulatory protein